MKMMLVNKHELNRKYFDSLKKKKLPVFWYCFYILDSSTTAGIISDISETDFGEC